MGPAEPGIQVVSRAPRARRARSRVGAAARSPKGDRRPAAATAADDPSRRGSTLPPVSRWLDLYGAVMMLWMVGHVSVAILAFAELFALAWGILQRDWAFHIDSILWGGLLLAALVALVRVGDHLWHATLALLTDRYDSDAQAIGGTLLPRKHHGALYAMVADLCRQIRSPPPDEIRVGHRPECCAAEFRTFSITTKRRLVLVIGLPVLAVFSVAELKVILAHELAHIGRGDTRLTVFVFRFVEMLRSQVACRAARWRHWVDPVYWFSRASAALLVRASIPIRRFQELRADGLSAAACGGELAVRTLLKEWLATHQFFRVVESSAGERQPGANPPHWTVFHQFADEWQECSPSGQRYLERRLLGEERSMLWDTHPTVGARISVMRRFPSRPAMEQGPARRLLPDFDAIARRLQPSALDDHWFD